MKTSFKVISALFSSLFLLTFGNLQAAESKPDTPPVTMVDLRPQLTKWGLRIENQGERNTCAVFALSGALEFALAKKLDRGVRLSEEYLNWSANVVNGDVRDGASFSEVVNGFNRWGICRENLMPYRKAQSAFIPPSAAALDDAQNIWNLGFRRHWITRSQRMTSADLDAVKKVLRSGYPVCGESGHCLLLIGFQDDARQPGGGTFLTRNCASVRYETMPYAEAARKFYSLLWIDIPDGNKAKNENGGGKSDLGLHTPND